MDAMGVSTDDTAASQRTEGVDTDMSDDSCDQEREQAGSLKLPSCVFNLCVLHSARAHHGSRGLTQDPGVFPARVLLKA